MKFESELEKGNFVIGKCSKCNKITWPPSEYCSNCFGKINWRKSDGVGTILEFSKNDDSFFCLVEFEKKIRILGTLDSTSKPPEIHKKVKIQKCQIDGNNYNFTLAVV